MNKNKLQEKSNYVNAFIATEAFLQQQDIAYDVLAIDEQHSLWDVARKYNIPYSSIVKAKIVQGGKRLFLLIVPLDRIIDFSMLANNFVTGLRYTTEIDNEILNNYYAALADSFVPIPGLLGILGVVDNAVDFDTKIYFHSGKNNNLIGISGRDFLNLHKESYKLDIACSIYSLKLKSSFGETRRGNVIENKFSQKRLHTRVREINELPVIPPIVSEILKLKADGNYNKKKLVNLISRDPGLAAQVIRWANAPYYGNQGKVVSIHDAVSTVLGVELVMNICIGVSVGKIVKLPFEGALGLKKFWHHSLYVATMAEQLAILLPLNKNVNKDLAYLCGLLHDIGHLVLGHVFSPQYSLLSQTVELNRDVKLVKLENHLLGNVNHQNLGVWLMEAWHMPKEIAVAIEQHHHEDYFGDHEIYAHLVFIADSAVKRLELGFNVANIHIPQQILAATGLSKDLVQQALENVVKNNKTDLDNLVNTLV